DPPTITFESGQTQHVLDWSVSGSADLPIVLQSSESGTPWTLECEAGVCASDYLVLSDSICSGHAPCYAGSHSVDHGGTTNWVFGDPPTPTATPTVTQTPTATDTPTNTPTARPGCC